MSKFLRINQVCEQTGLKRSTVYLWISENRFPKPLKLSERITVWKEIDIEEWMNLKEEEFLS